MLSKDKEWFVVYHGYGNTYGEQLIENKNEIPDMVQELAEEAALEHGDRIYVGKVTEVERYVVETEITTRELK